MPPPLSAILVPSGLNPGDQYFLVFVSSGRTQASSIDINFYNNWINTIAQSSSKTAGVTYRAIASTSSDSIRAQIEDDYASNGLPIHSPVYNMNGDKVSDVLLGGSTEQSLFNTENIDLDNPIKYDQNGLEIIFDTESQVFTGSNPDGTPATGRALGDPNPIFGRTTFTDSRFIYDPLSLTVPTPINFERKIYGLSDALTVPVPAPSTYLLTSAGAYLTILNRKKTSKPA